VLVTVVVGGYLLARAPGTAPGVDGAGAAGAKDASNMARKPAPALELKDPGGAARRLADLAGNVVMVHFWATWCPPCLDELPQILALGKAYAGKPFRIYAVSLDESWADALKMLPQEGLPREIISVLDPTQAAAERYGSYQYPESYLLDRELRIVAKWVGPQDWNGELLRGIIDRMISAPEPSASPSS
jgi:cytochrome c biogenesis protein CcmG, thiol:disulfide interchange protein DsbE